MNFLLDTNVVSEGMKPRPNNGVTTWLAEVDEDRVFISVVTLLEVRYGIERLPMGAKRARLNDWLEQELPSRFEGRILNVETKVADVCGTIIARSDAAGYRIEAMDALIAATAEVHQLTLVTRNVTDFQFTLRNVVNPWH